LEPTVFRFMTRVCVGGGELLNAYGHDFVQHSLLREVGFSLMNAFGLCEVYIA
jgi:hypothetical protein